MKLIKARWRKANIAPIQFALTRLGCVCFAHQLAYILQKVPYATSKHRHLIIQTFLQKQAFQLTEPKKRRNTLANSFHFKVQYQTKKAGFCMIPAFLSFRLLLSSHKKKTIIPSYYKMEKILLHWPDLYWRRIMRQDGSPVEKDHPSTEYKYGKDYEMNYP